MLLHHAAWRVFPSGLAPVLCAFSPADIQAWIDRNPTLVKAGGIFFGVMVVSIIYGVVKQLKKRKGQMPDTPKKMIRAARRLSKRGEWIQAGDFMLQAGETQEALRCYASGRAYLPAARLCEKLGKTLRAAQYYEQAENWDLAGRFYAESGQLENAESCFVRINRLISIAQMYESANRFDRAAMYFEKVGRHDSASVMYEKAGRLPEAARLGEAVLKKNLTKSGTSFSAQKSNQKVVEEVHRIAGLYRSSSQFKQASDVFTLVALHEDAAAELERGEDFAGAAALYAEAESFQKASDCYYRAGDPATGEVLFAESLRQQGTRLEEAAAIFEKHKHHDKAAGAYESMDRFLEAGRAYEAGGNLSKAVRCYERAQAMEDISRLYMALGDYQRAASAAERAGDTNTAVQAYVRARRYYQAGRIFFEAGQRDEALALLQKVERSDESHRLAVRLIADIFLYKKMYGPARQQYEMLLQGQQISSENLDVAYHLGMVYEGEGHDAQALKIYEQVLAVDYMHQDTSARVEAIQKRISNAELTQVNMASDTNNVEREMLLLSNTQSLIGLELGGCRILEKIGSGGMGAVFKAHHQKLDKTVALKVLSQAHVDEKDSAERLVREARAAARLEHHNIVQVLDVDEMGGLYYIVMQHVDGQSLSHLVQHEGPLSTERAAVIMRGIAGGLEEAHAKGVIHRDIKPDNILLSAKDEPKIVDFGLARSEASDNTLTQSGKIMGSPFFMSPEQGQGKHLDHRTDLYSLGATAYFMVTGQRPYEGKTPIAVIFKHIHESTPDPSKRVPDLSSWLKAVIMKLMAKNPDHRFQSATELLEVLQ